MKKKIIISIMLSLVVCTSLAACSSTKAKKESNNTKKDTIIIGTEPNAAPTAECIKPILEEQGYKVEITYFDDYVLPDTALVEGSIDCNIYQHTPYMEMYNKAHDSKLMMADLIVYPNLGIYSTAYNSLDKVPDGSQVSITNDASNEDRALRLLQDAKLITLPEKPGETGLYASSDIIENKKRLEFVSVAETQLVESMNDVAISVCPSSHILANKMDPKSAFIMEEPNEDAMIGITIRPEDKDTKWVKDMLESYKNDKAKAAFDKSYQGAWQLVIE
ncbi:MAG: MetQ/NlpA family ABC transporter substrate-binding protein [Lachnospiraceae bacterium]